MWNNQKKTWQFGYHQRFSQVCGRQYKIAVKDIGCVSKVECRKLSGIIHPHSNIKKNDNKFPIFGVLSCGGGTPCFNGNMEWMNDHGLTVWMAPDSEILVKRLKSETDSRPLIAGLDEAELKRQVEDRLKSRAPYYSLANLKITNPSISVQELHEQILHAQALL